MELYVSRKYFKDTYTIGKLFIEDKFLTNTLEDKVRKLDDKNKDGDFTDPGEGKVYGETAIPEGRYKVIVSDSPKLKRRLPLLLDVPGFTGIRIHAGKNAKWTEGCVLVGDNKNRGELENGPYYENYIIDAIDIASANNEETFITIK
jgi:hypothetical protein